jgi:uncharacterized membrane protein
MNWPFVHLSLNHFPLIGLFFALALLGAAWIRRSDELARTGFVTLVVLAVFATFVYLTGEPAEEAIEHLSGVSETSIETHEEAALVAFIAMEVLGVVALAGLWLRRGAERAWLGGLGLLTFVVAGLMVWTAHRGGQIRHPELRGAEAPAAQVEEENGSGGRR